MIDITLSWSDFKAQLTDRHLVINSYISTNGYYYIIAFDSSIQFTCILNQDSGADQVDFETNYKDSASNSPANQVITQFEKNDKDLKLSSGSGLIDGSTGLATVDICVPGTMSNGDGRYIAGGTAFFDICNAGDKVLDVCVIDKDNVLGAGANFVVKSYTDLEAPSDNQGWYVPPVRGQVEVEPIGGYGFLPAQLYLRITAQKSTGHYSGIFYLNVFWGKKE